MSQDGPKPGKSRRRFLADLLFLGGGVTAASLLARSTFFQDPGQPEPVLTPDSIVIHEPVVPDQPIPGMVAMPEDVEPQPEETTSEPPPQKEVCPPQVRGRMKMPEPNPAGGARPIQYVPETQK